MACSIPAGFRLFVPGCYRVSMLDGRFGQVHRRAGRGWRAEVRTADGSLERHAGIWGSLAAAAEELEAIDAPFRPNRIG